MKKDFKTIKNIILLIASALTLVAVTFSWFSLSKRAGNFTIASNVSGTTISVKYNESTDGTTYKELNGNLSMKNMYEGKTSHYRMDVRTFDDAPVKIIMSFDGLSASNITANYVYFDYKVVCKATGEVLGSGTELNMGDYTSTNVFAIDVSSYQKNGKNEFYVYYDVYVRAESGKIESGSTSLGEVKLLGQQIN